MLENYLIECCSPTLASLKTGSLFNCRGCDPETIDKSVHQWNEDLADTGITMCILRKTPNSALIYVYRTTALARTLKDPEIASFLSSYGYKVRSCSDGCQGCDEHCYSESNDIICCLDHLKRRISSPENDPVRIGFPHEIGIFLDYPLADVKGFIVNKGRNCKYTGLWKVYGDEDRAIKTFARWDKCRKIYKNLWQSGKRSILQLTVAG